MPQLRHGAGRDYKDGGCIMQVVSYLWDGQWTDHPECVHPVLINVCISINDHVNDVERQKLWRLIPRLMNTRVLIGEHREVALRLVLWAAEQSTSAEAKLYVETANRILSEGDLKPMGDGDSIFGSLSRFTQPNVGWLEKLLDELDRVSGRTSEEYWTVNEEDLNKVCNLLEAASR